MPRPRKQQPVNKNLDWKTAVESWHPIVRATYESAQTNPYTELWYQSDVAFFFAVLNEHDRMLTELVEPNANLAKTIFDNYSRLGLTLRGRVEAGVALVDRNDPEPDYKQMTDYMEKITTKKTIRKVTDNG